MLNIPFPPHGPPLSTTMMLEKWRNCSRRVFTRLPKEARVEEMRKKIEEKVTAKLNAQFYNEWAKKK